MVAYGVVGGVVGVMMGLLIHRIVVTAEKSEYGVGNTSSGTRRRRGSICESSQAQEGADQRWRRRSGRQEVADRQLLVACGRIMVGHCVGVLPAGWSKLKPWGRRVVEVGHVGVPDRISGRPIEIMILITYPMIGRDVRAVEWLE